MVSGVGLRVVFLGTPSFAVATLDALLHSKHTVAAVVTQPDRARGRGQRRSDAPVKVRAVQTGIPVLQPTALNDPSFLDALDRSGCDIGVVAAYGRILPTSVISKPRLGMINVHASLLPRYRGAAPVHRAVIAGEKETGVTIMRVVKALDAGPMLAREARSIGENETSEQVEHALAQQGALLLVATLDRLAERQIQEIPQDETAATYAPRLTKEDGIVDWSQSAVRIHDLIRGLHPWPHAFTFLNRVRLILLRSSASPEPADRPFGTIVKARGDDLAVATGNGTLHIRELQLEGKRPTEARHFLAGHRVTEGMRLSHSP
jgi:methionyl-tRNA formyltransferase